MRLRCSACGCYVHATDEGFPYLFDTTDVLVQPCKRCLRVAVTTSSIQQQAVAESFRLEGQ